MFDRTLNTLLRTVDTHDQINRTMQDKRLKFRLNTRSIAIDHGRIEIAANILNEKETSNKLNSLTYLL